jgi:hypothetical protein
MGSIFYFFTCKRFKVLSIAVTTLLIFFCFSVKAQRQSNDNAYSIALSTGYDVPVGDLTYTFKPAVTYGISFMKTRNDFTVSVNFGHQVYKPKLDTFYYRVDASNYGTIHYDNFTITSLYLGATYNLENSDNLKAYGGFNFGIYYTHMIYHSSDEYLVDDSDLNEEDLYLAPKLGLTYLITDNIGLGIECKYNLFTPSGQKADNPAVGTLYNSYAGNVVLTYNF